MLIMLDSNDKGHYYCVSALYSSLLCMDTLYHLHNFSINLKLFRGTDKDGWAGGHRPHLPAEIYWKYNQIWSSSH